MSAGRFWGGWGISARLLAIAVLPASIMFVAVTATLYASAKGDVRRDVAARGQLIATALAQSSQYGLVSGNVVHLRATLRRMLEADPSIACIAITDGKLQPVVSSCQSVVPHDLDTFNAPIRIESMPQLDLFDPGPTAAPTTPLRIIGTVQVDMSPAPIFAAKRSALLAASALVLAAAVVSCLVGLRLTRRLRRTLASVMEALRAIRQGRFDVVLDAHNEGELGELQKTIVQMADTLNEARHDLEQQVVSRTRELQAAVDLSRHADAEKRRLIVRSNALVEEERRRIALDLHDHLGAALISVRLEASGLAARARGLGEAEMEGDARRIASMAESIYATTRDIVKRLRPEVIDTLGLAGAVEELVRNAGQVCPGTRFNFTLQPGLPDLRGELAMPAFRVIQEALNNIVKHAGASQVAVRLGRSVNGQFMRILIEDNGQGFEPAAQRSAGIGLIGMRERVVASGGELSISAMPGQGVTVSVTLPFGDGP